MNIIFEPMNFAINMESGVINTTTKAICQFIISIKAKVPIMVNTPVIPA